MTTHEQALRALAQAYDREDAAQRGEPDPWNLDDPGDIGDSDMWISERLACARVAAEAFLSALEPAAPEGLTPLKPASAGAWRIKKGEPIPQWLEKTENVELTAGCDLIVIEAEDAGFDVYRSDPNSFANMMEGTCPDPNKHATVTGAPTNLHTPSVLESRISKLHAEIAELTRAAPEGQQEAGADAVRFLYKHGALTHIAAREAVELLTSNGFEISRRSK